MSKTRITINDREVKRLFEDLEQMGEIVMKDGHKYFRNKTPIRTGNARSKTQRKNLTIQAKYPYAGRLDEGWSGQAPKGMSAPTEDYIDREVGAYIKKVSR